MTADRSAGELAAADKSLQQDSDGPSGGTRQAASSSDDVAAPSTIDDSALFNDLHYRVISRGKQEALHSIETLKLGFMLQEARELAHEWWDKAETLGFLQISEQARYIEELLGKPRLALDELEAAYQQLLRLYSEAEARIQKNAQPIEDTAAGSLAGSEVVETLAGLRQKMASDGEQETLNVMKSLDSKFSVQEAKQLAHSWAGRGGTFGFPEITSKARQIESLLEKPASGRVTWELQNAYMEMLTLFTVARRQNSPAEEILPTPEQEVLPEPATAAEPAVIEEAKPVVPVHAENMADDEDHQENVIVVDDAVPAGVDEERHQENVTVAGDAVPARAEEERNQESVTAAGDAVPAPEDIPPTPQIPAITAQKLEPDKLSIVIADDDPAVMGLIKDTIKNQGMECFLASDGADALELIRKLRPACAILDVSMPRMDGFEVLSAVRNDPLTRGIQVVLMTARQNETDIMRGFALGANDYILKPLDQVELLIRLKRLSKKKPKV